MQFPKFDDFDFMITAPIPTLEYNYNVAVDSGVMVKGVGIDSADSADTAIVNFPEYRTQLMQYREQYFGKIAAFRRACEAFLLAKYPMLDREAFDMCWERAEAASVQHGYDAVADSLFEFVDFAQALYLHIVNKTEL